jgi:2-polyprenyl-3-methyl-5-hydroxy-6-metoxy-1,4-benzoquinol methylase
MDDVIQTTLQKIGLSGPLLPEIYEDKILAIKKVGKKYFDTFDKVIDLETGEVKNDQMHKLYKVKNSHEELSILVSNQAYSPIYKAMLEWLSNFYGERSPTSLVEIGCDNGLLLQALENLWSLDNTVGLDNLNESIIMAKKLAHRFGSKAQFQRADILKKISLKEPFDCVFLPFLLHEITWQDNSYFYENLHSMLNESGKLITINRFPSPEQEAELIVLMERNGFELDVQTNIFVMDEKFPVLVFKK